MQVYFFSVYTSVLVVSMLVFDWARGVETTIASCDELCYPMSSPNLWALSTLTYNSALSTPTYNSALFTPTYNSAISTHTYSSALSTPVYLSKPSYTNTMETYSSAQHESLFALCNVTCVYHSQCGQVHFSPNVFTSWASADHKVMEAR